MIATNPTSQNDMQEREKKPISRLTRVLIYCGAGVILIASTAIGTALVLTKNFKNNGGNNLGGVNPTKSYNTDLPTASIAPSAIIAETPTAVVTIEPTPIETISTEPTSTQSAEVSVAPTDTLSTSEEAILNGDFDPNNASDRRVIIEYIKTVSRSELDVSDAEFDKMIMIANEVVEPTETAEFVSPMSKLIAMDNKEIILPGAVNDKKYTETFKPSIIFCNKYKDCKEYLRNIENYTQGFLDKSYSLHQNGDDSVDIDSLNKFLILYTNYIGRNKQLETDPTITYSTLSNPFAKYAALYSLYTGSYRFYEIVDRTTKYDEYFANATNIWIKSDAILKLSSFLSTMKEDMKQCVQKEFMPNFESALIYTIKI